MIMPGPNLGCETGCPTCHADPGSLLLPSRAGLRHGLGVWGGCAVQARQQRRRQFIEKARCDTVAQLTMQHAAVGQAEIQAAACAGDGDIHQASFFFQAIPFLSGILVWKKALFQSADKYGMKLQSLGGMHGHQLECFLPRRRLVLAGFQRGMGEEGRERVWRILVILRAMLQYESGGSVDQFVQVFQPFGAFLFRLVVGDQAAVLQACARSVPAGASCCRLSRSCSISAIKAVMLVTRLAAQPPELCRSPQAEIVPVARFPVAVPGCARRCRGWEN